MSAMRKVQAIAIVVAAVIAQQGCAQSQPSAGKVKESATAMAKTPEEQRLVDVIKRPAPPPPEGPGSVGGRGRIDPVFAAIWEKGISQKPRSPGTPPGLPETVTANLFFLLTPSDAGTNDLLGSLLAETGTVSVFQVQDLRKELGAQTAGPFSLRMERGESCQLLFEYGRDGKLETPRSMSATSVRADGSKLSFRDIEIDWDRKLNAQLRVASMEVTEGELRYLGAMPMQLEGPPGATGDDAKPTNHRAFVFLAGRRNAAESGD